ncbi:hypothetical protein FA10DRAFT_260746 [Acaromyces ingoldii]|uniref:WW domain-containing protein n=1 Tax=Acaromyces ingoldii TaxID=215250 RepID=A0A316YTE5_9BASI|nr:hypothetical protein FA10DRAFT_260746 [Acaromyces ingoldii]PWN91015.1 hypothetical protein FA10DRAFT_260746 [Acaromyces ingoldii]
MLRRSARARVPAADPDSITTSPNAGAGSSPGSSSRLSPSPNKRKRSAASPDGSPTTTTMTTTNADDAKRSPSSPPLKSRKVILSTRSSRARLAGRRSGEADDEQPHSPPSSARNNSHPADGHKHGEASQQAASAFASASASVSASVSNGAGEHMHQQQQTTGPSSTKTSARDLDLDVEPLQGLSQQQAGESKNKVGEVEEDGDDDAWRHLDDLTVEADVRDKLTTVMEAYFGDLMASKVEVPAPDARSTRGSGGGGGGGHVATTTTTLRDVVRAKEVKLKTIRNHLLRVREPLVSAQSARALLSGSHVGPGRDRVEADRRTLSQIGLLLGVVDEVAASLRQARRDDDLAAVAAAATGTAPTAAAATAASKRDTVKKEEEEDDGGVFDDLDRPPREARYALHMRLPGGDYYTNAVSLQPSEALELDTGHANLVSVVHPAPPAAPVPTLGQRLAKSQPQVAARAARFERQRRERANEAKATPVSHLYYGPYASFAPAYDSFDGTMGLAASCALWRSRYEDRQLLRRMARDAPPPPFELGSAEEGEEGIDELVASLGDDVDADGLLRSFYRQLDDSAAADVDEALARNEALLVLLDEMQQQRIERAFADDMLASRDARDKGHHSRATVAADKSHPSHEEQEVAGALVASLAHLVARRPRTPQGSLVLPREELLRRATSSALVDPALVDGRGSAGYWGIIDDASYVQPPSTSTSGSSSRRSMPSSSRRGPPAIRDNETVQLTREAEAKAVAASQHKGAPCLGSTRDRGRELLERVAATRAYSDKDHPHDRPQPTPPKKLPTAPPGSQGAAKAAAGQSPYPQQQQQQQQQPQQPQQPQQQQSQQSQHPAYRQQQPAAATPTTRPTQSYATTTPGMVNGVSPRPPPTGWTPQQQQQAPYYQRSSSNSSWSTPAAQPQRMAYGATPPQR